MVRFLDLNKQYLSIKDEIDNAISAVINDSAFISGKYVKEFEENFSTYIEANFCQSVGNGTDALEIAIEALNLPKNSEIIVPANSFISSSEAVTRNGHKVVFCDVKQDDYTIDIADLKNRISKNTRAIIAVHLYGHPCDMDELLKISKEFDIKIIEDCAQAHGAKYKNIKVGTFGDLGCFSFYPGKNLGAYGDAGAIVTNNEYLFNKCKMIANHGRMAKYDHKFEGRNSRMDGIQGAILNVKLKYLDQWILTRKDAAQKYNELLSKISDIALPIEKDWASHVYHLYVLRYNMRDELKTNLSNQGISCGIHYPIALPKLEAYKYLNQYNEKGFAWISDNSLLSLPISDTINLNEVIEVSEALINSI